MLGKVLAFTSVYFFELCLINGLRGKAIRKTASLASSRIGL